MLKERFELAKNRIEEIRNEHVLTGAYDNYFSYVADMILMILNPEETAGYNNKLYEDILGDGYENSFGNPTCCDKVFRNSQDGLTDSVDIETLENTGIAGIESKNEIAICNDGFTSNKTKIAKISQMLCYLYSEFRGLIPYAYELKYYEGVDSDKTNKNSDSANDGCNDSRENVADVLREIITIYMELFIEIYVLFIDAYSFGVSTDDTSKMLPKDEELRDIIYWFNSDNCDIISPFRIRQQLDPSLDFALNIIMNSNYVGMGTEPNVDYLYKYGEYITENEIGVAKFLAKLPQSDIDAMASTYTEGYRIGFVKAGKPLHKKKTVNIRYNLGFERVVKAAIKNFRDMGLEPVIYRAATLSLDKRGVSKIGYLGAIPNKQYDYDHREDQALYLDKDFVNRKTLVIKNAYEDMKQLANTHAGPAVMEVFGELPFSPVSKSECVTLDETGRSNQVELTTRVGQLTNEYIKGDERSFTIISYPIPEIGDKFEEIFRDTVKLNTLDYKRYEQMQQLIIDTLDTADRVRIEGCGANRTRLTVKTYKITDATKQTSFENCVADVNIPVGEVFTSPVLTGTNGVLNVSEVYLFGLNYIDLSITFKDGMIVDYSCSNFEDEEENKKYIRENILHNHETLPIGEFAIGTNTTAYRMARDYKIEDRMPILIGEKTGPHFAVGDTCYSHEEDVAVFNPDGKEIIARDNELTAKYRETDQSQAYYNCHTDITIPYDELKGIYAVREDGSEVAIIEDGRFVLSGLEELNEPLDR